MLGTQKKRPTVIRSVENDEVQFAQPASPPLERKLQSELNHARIVHRGVYLTKARCTNVIDRQAELRVVEQVEKLRPKVQAHVFPRQCELLDDRKIRIDEVWAVDRHARSISKVADRSGKASRVNVLQTRIVGCIGITAGDSVRAVKVVPVAAAIEGNSRLVAAVDERIRKPR